MNHTMESPISVANYFISKSFETGEELTPMKLVKLVYIAHGWYLALTDGQPLIPEAVQAWKYGPVVESVYQEFKGYRNAQITCFGSVSDSGKSITYPSVQDEQKSKFLDKIWEKYGGYTGLQLSTLTHQPGTPWYKMWNDGLGRDWMGTIIPNEMIKDHYKSLMQSAYA